MSRIHWLLEDTSYQNDFDGPLRLARAALSRGDRVTTAKRTPFGGTDWEAVLPPPDEPTVFYGTINAIGDFQNGNIPPERLPKPLVWYDFESFLCSTYYRKYGDLVLQQRREFMTLNDFLGSTAEVYRDLGVHGAVFVRPDDNEKTFNGAVVRQKELRNWYASQLGLQGGSGKLRIVVAQPRPLQAEYRFVIVDGEPVAGGRVRQCGSLAFSPVYPLPAAWFAQKVALKWAPYPVFVVDVAELASDQYLMPEDRFRLLEIGGWNAAGMYQLDAVAVVDAIAQHLSREDRS